MEKRVRTNIGNVFCVELENNYKRYFQYVCNDIEMLNSSVIKVFKTRYPMNYEPVLIDIIKDEVDFYAHTILRAGLLYNAWYKVGKTMSVDNSELNQVVFGYTKDSLYIDQEIITVNPLEHWIIFKINEKTLNVGILPKILLDKIEYGAVISYIDIVNRIKYGYYKYQSPIYDVIKRIPHADVNSYTRREFDNKTIYQHFLGENVVQEIIILSDGNVELTEGHSLDRPKFWKTNWKYDEFITEEEFNNAFNQQI